MGAFFLRRMRRQRDAGPVVEVGNLRQPVCVSYCGTIGVTPWQHGEVSRKPALVMVRFVSASLLLLVAGTLLGPVQALAQEPAPPAPVEAQEPAAQEPAEQPEPPPCVEPYTPTSCSVENEKYVRTFDWLAVMLLPAALALALPLAAAVVRTSSMGWWRTSPLGRWFRPTAMGLGLAFLFFWLLPLLGQEGILPAGVALLGFPGVKTDFASACQICSAQVSNHPPLFGVLGSFGMPPMGLAIDHPFQLLAALLLAFALFSVLHLVIHRLWRSRAGFATRCAK